MKFLIDKALSPKVKDFLEKNGKEALIVDDVFSESRVEDQQIFDFAIDNGFIVVTADVDFGQLLAYTRNKKPSVIMFRVLDQRLPNILNKLNFIINHYNDQLKNGILLNVEDNSIHTFQLPLG